MTTGLLPPEPRPGDSWGTLRAIFVAFGAGLVIVGVVVVLLTSVDDKSSGVDPGAASTLVGGAGALSAIASAGAGQPLTWATPRDLARSYRSRLFLRLGVAQAATAVGFYAVLLSGSPVPYVVGAVWAAVAGTRLAPTRANLARVQNELDHQGCPYRLVDVLQGRGITL